MKFKKNMTEVFFYSVFHRFRQAKFTYGGSILSSRQFLLFPKNAACFKSGPSGLENNIFTTLIWIRETFYSRIDVCTLYFMDLDLIITWINLVMVVQK